jgi:hypothetical protein
LVLGNAGAQSSGGDALVPDTFTVRYKLRHRKARHLFQWRYKAVLVNPQTAGISPRSPIISGSIKRGGLITLREPGFTNRNFELRLSAYLKRHRSIRLRILQR